MADPTELAATLRRMVAREDLPWTASDAPPGADRVVWDSDDDAIAAGEDGYVPGEMSDHTAEFVVWCANNAEAIATALERGAAAEAVVAAVRAWDAATGHEPEGELSALWDARSDAEAAHDAMGDQ